jgi:CRP-like cAMP-binding protein
MLTRQGKETKIVYLLVKGRAKVEADSKMRLSQIGPGEICGEMSFLDHGRASASVIVEEDVEAHVIEWSALEDLFELFPHLASRFYQSLAVNISRRLRQQISSS